MRSWPSHVIEFYLQKQAIKDIYTIWILGSTVTVMSPDGTPIQVNTAALQAASIPNSMGTLSFLTASVLLKMNKWYQVAWNYKNNFSSLHCIKFSI